MPTTIIWDEANILWNSNPYKWDEIELVEEVIASSDVSSNGASGEEILWNVQQLDAKKKKRFIKLVCKVKGIETYSGQKTVKEDIDITVADVELVVKEVLGIDLTVENIDV